MEKLIYYCPKCGKQLIDMSNHNQKSFLFICDDCSYTLLNPYIIDISFKSKGLAKALSNLCPYPFEFDGIKCSSMEAFIQSLKIRDKNMQKDVCSKTGLFCYNIREMFDDWRKTQNVYWKGEIICRQSKEYILLLTKAYEALLQQSPTYLFALKKVKDIGYKLNHSIGCPDPTETLLTPNEFISILNHLITNCIN